MKGKKRTAIIKSLLLTLLITVMLPLGASAADSTDNLVLNKEVWLEDDGTYTVQLEAYAKGQVSAETIKVVKPADIILVLDQSGSMVQNNVSGIPTDTYSRVTGVTNEELLEKSYYYRVDDEYYKIVAVEEIVTSKVEWVDANGNIYTADQLSSSFTLDGQEYTTASPYVTSSLETWTRERYSDYSSYYRYVKDTTDDTTADTTEWGSANQSRNRVAAKYDDSYTVSFYSSNTRAVAYITVSQQEVNTVRYTYKYIDGDGNEVTIGHSETGAEATIDDAVCNIALMYERGTTEGTRLEALQYAADEFIESIQASAVKNNIAHRVAIVGFASDSYYGSDDDYYYANSELFVGATQYNYQLDGESSTYNTAGNLASDKYGLAFQNVLVEDEYNNLLASVDNLAGRGGTHPSLGFAMANGIFGANSNVEEDGTARTRIVIFLTDGHPGDGDAFDTDEADLTYTQVNTTKNTYGATVYSVAVLEGTASTNNDTFLKTVSSSNSYTLVTKAEELENFFETVDKDINNTSTTVTLSENAIVLDCISNYFQVPTGFNTDDNMTVQVAKHLGYETFAAPTAAPEGVTKYLSYGLGDVEIKGASARGFNFVSDENLVTTTVIGDERSEEDVTIEASGYKLIVTITGLLAKDDAATGTWIETNTTDAGVWDTDTNGEYGIVKAFNMPHTLIKQDAFVIDYAKEATLDAFGLSANRLDSDADSIFSKVDAAATALTETYGKAAIVANGETTDLTYEPTTMNWSGFDTFYALGKDANLGDRKTQNLWSKISVIPANNVYYEDDFVTNTTEGTVGIVYSGEWTTEGTAGNNKETADTVVHGGWQNGDLANDAAYTDGTSHVSSTNGATATFTFTGTGVDIYSRTNATTGLVKAQLFTGEGTEIKNMTQTYVIDNLAESGDYYQIPTATFKNLQHGTYTVKLTVAARTTGETTRSTYYLDGIRVYNPLSATQETNEVVSGAYGNEVGAMFKEVRDILLDSTTLNAGSTDANGVVFIDKTAEGAVGSNTSVIGTYKEYGPKNEVYLAKDQAIAFYLVGGNVQVGLKAPEGATVADVTNGVARSPLTINASSDLFYEISPNEDGLIIIKNTTDNLLAVTKIKLAGTGVIGQVNVASVLTYADTFNSLPVIDWELESEENAPEVDDKEDTTPEDNSGDVEIENPEPETEMKEAALLRQLMKQILGLFRNWLVG